MSVERLTIPDVKLDKNTISRSIIDAEKVKECAMEIYWRLKALEDAVADEESEEYDIGRLRELVEADRAGRCVVLPDVDERSRLSIADGLEDVFKEWAYEDKDVGLFGMSDGERKLADALMKGLKGENNAS